MNCPICSKTSGIDIDLHSDGYSDNLFECNCGAIWINNFGEITLLNKKVA